MPRRHGEGADVIAQAGLLRRDEVGERPVRLALRRFAPAGAGSGTRASTVRARLVGVELDVVADGVGREEAVDAARA